MNFDDLVERGLVHKKAYTAGEYTGLSVFKYSRKVFYDNLWGLDDRLLEARGMVLDSMGNILVWPFRKVFNYQENGTTIGEDQLCTVVRKVNGFLGCVTNTVHYGVICSTTGTLDSDYAKLVEKHVDTSRICHDYTFLFEICDNGDPHIVAEEEGAYLIGMRDLSTGLMVSEATLDKIAAASGFKRPEVFEATFAEVLSLSKTVQHEGFMVYSGSTALKIKSKHYLAKKFLMRMSAGKVDGMFTNPNIVKQTIDEEFYEIVDFITTHFMQEVWQAMNDQQRREIIEGYFNAN
jgi:hypothetical protein